jgi:hypothetical protein
VEIEEWCKAEGLSSRAASSRLLQAHNEKISHHSVNKHMHEHFDVKEEVQEQYQKNQIEKQHVKSQQHFLGFVEKQLSDIEMLEQTAAENYELAQTTVAWLRELIDQRIKPPFTLVQLRKELQAEMRQAMRTKAEFLGDDPQSRLVDVFRDMWGDDDAGADT